jgi:uroporphyrin-III C-methyltransferase
LVGGGPGDPGLITVRGRQLLAAADVIVTDRLGPRGLLDAVGPDVEVIDVGKTPGHHPIPQTRINEILVEHARRGRAVVRLKGGDPFVLGRGGEEAIHCVANGIPVEVVPGVTSAVSVPAAAGIPVTHRGITASFVVASAHDGATAALDALRDAPVTSTVVLLMGVTALADTARRLVESGRPPTTPVALVESGWTPAQRTTVTTLAEAAEVAEREGVRSPAVVVVGDVVRVREQVGDLVPPGLVADAAPSLVLLAHGSPDPRHAKGVEKVAEQVRRRWPGHVHVAYLDHDSPSATDVAQRLEGGVLVPLLLTTAYHVRSDVPEAAAAMDALERGHYAVASALGPDRLLFAAADELLSRAGFAPDPHTGVVLFAGGSSDREAISTIDEAVGNRSVVGWGPWAVAALAGGDEIDVVADRLRAAGAQRVLVLTYMVADGVLRDRMVTYADKAGAEVVPGSLGETDALADLVVQRAGEALATGR